MGENVRSETKEEYSQIFRIADGNIPCGMVTNGMSDDLELNPSNDAGKHSVHSRGSQTSTTIKSQLSVSNIGESASVSTGTEYFM